MSLVSLYATDVVIYSWIENKHKKGSYFQPKKEHTYMVVFGPGQDGLLKFFKEEVAKDYNILYEAPKAFNKRYKTPPRNTLIIFETKDE